VGNPHERPGGANVVSSVDLGKLPSRFAGQKWSRDLIAEFPKDCDPCGERGEIHTIVVGGPMFKKRIEVEICEVMQRDGLLMLTSCQWAKRIVKLEGVGDENKLRVG
jgi:diphthamide synthase (EF-2-diphthine--ammonia ligase)